MNKRLILALLVIGSVIGMGTALATSSPAANTRTAKVRLLSPPDGAVIQQNNPASGCPYSPTRGYGLRIDFVWKTTKGKHFVVAYHVVASLGASIPIVDVTIPDTSYTWIACAAYTTNLEGWSWSVQALDAQNNVLGTAEARFGFAPCQLDDGTPCS
jgi:hypothetical protein